MVFISGDTIDGYVEKIDEKGVSFVSEQTTVRFAEHSRFDRVWLNSLAGSLKKTANEKIQRLMTVPRSMKDDPPTHLLLAVTGDLLRGRLIYLDDKHAKFEVRSEVAEIPRQQIAEVIWLHERKWDVTSKPQLPAQDQYQIHVVQQNRGLTFSPTKVTDGLVHGESSLLGACQINIKQVSQILFGPNIDQRVSVSRQSLDIVFGSTAASVYRGLGGFIDTARRVLTTSRQTCSSFQVGVAGWQADPTERLCWQDAGGRFLGQLVWPLHEDTSCSQCSGWNL